MTTSISSLLFVTLAEIGDKTQFATVSLAVEYGEALPVLLGTTMSMVVADGIGIAPGAALGRRVPDALIRFVSAGVFVGFDAFTPVARCPLIATVTKVKPRPWVVEGRIEPRPTLRLCGTFDHRVIDGYHAAEISSEVEDLLSHPEALLTPEEREAWRAAQHGAGRAD